MDRRWFRLLETYKQDGHVGLTLSFLIGALRTPVGTLADDDTSRSELLLLLRRMRDETPKGLYVRIAECQTLHQPIAALFPGDPMAGSPSAGDLVVGDSSPSRLHAWPQYFDDETRSVDSLAAGLWKIFAPAIHEGRFSYLHGKFVPYDESEMKFIERALAHRDDT